MGKNASKNGYFDVFDAASQGDLISVKYFIEKEHVSVDKCNDHQQTAAHLAVSNGHLNVLQYLLSKNPFLYSKEDDKRDTIFHVALKHGYLDIVDFLLQQFQNEVLKKTAYGQTPLQLAAEYGHLNVVQYLIDQHKVDVEELASTEYGDTVVHVAAKGGHLDVVGYLLEEKNVNVELLNSKNQSPVFSATIGNHSNIVRYLVEEHDANVTIIDADRNTILHYAFMNDNVKVPRFLLDEKKIRIDVNRPNREGETLVSLAIEQHNLELLEYIVGEKKAELNVRDKYGDYPLHRAARTSNLDVLMYLVGHGAKPSKKNFYGKTPYDVAKLHNKYMQHGMHTRFLEYLELISPRRRRSLSSRAPHRSSVSTYPYRILPELNEFAQLRGLGGREGIHESQILSKHSKHFNRFILLAYWYIRYTTGLRNQLVKNEISLLSSEDILLRFDPLAIDVVEGEFEGD